MKAGLGPGDRIELEHALVEVAVGELIELGIARLREATNRDQSSENQARGRHTDDYIGAAKLDRERLALRIDHLARVANGAAIVEELDRRTGWPCEHERKEVAVLGRGGAAESVERARDIRTS